MYSVLLTGSTHIAMVLSRLAGTAKTEKPAGDLVPPEMMRCALSMGVLTQEPLLYSEEGAEIASDAKVWRAPVMAIRADSAC